MSKILLFVLGSMLSLPPTFAQTMRPSASAKTAATSTNTSAQQTYKDIQSTLGFVPEFLKAYPEVSVSGAWQEMKSFQMSPKTNLSGKQKELIGLAVSSQIPCVYCVYFHTKAAKANGATDNEIKEAIAMSAMTRHWSTWLNGTSQDMASFRQEIDKAMQFAKSKMDASEKTATVPADLSTTEGVYADMKNMFGFVPTVFKEFPADAIAGAWKAERDLTLNPNTSLNGKDKSLIGIAVAAQIPCDYCNYFSTQSALKLDSATAIEVKEAITMSAIVRHWSTVLNGNQVNEKKFRSEVDRIFSKPMTKPMRTGSSSEAPAETPEAEQ